MDLDGNGGCIKSCFRHKAVLPGTANGIKAFDTALLLFGKLTKREVTCAVPRGSQKPFEKHAYRACEFYTVPVYLAAFDIWKRTAKRPFDGCCCLFLRGSGPSMCGQYTL